VKITVALCTWNRAQLLDRTLDSLSRLRIPPDLDWEVLVVNNRSTDETADVLSRHSTRLPLNRLDEPRAGVAHARNRGLHAARGRLLLWTDDDVEVDTGWVEAYLAAEQEFPAASFWGGRIDPWFETERPEWLRRAWPLVSDVYGERRLADRPLPIDDVARLPYGANYAAVTEVHRRYPFDTRLGRRRGQRLAGEETDAMLRMLKDGHLAWWLPLPRVRHWVPREAMTLDYLARYYFGAGSTSEIMRRSVFTPYHLWCKALFREMLYRLVRPVSGPEVWVKSYLRAKYHWGRFSQIHRSRRARRRRR
jgi:glycosyltransferase involved in cell wall biosynthesis